MTQPDAWPEFGSEEIAAVTAVLASGRVNSWSGEQVAHFEHEYAAHLGRVYAIAVANGSLALELALHALRIGPGDEVITTPRSFVATASAIVLAGAKPVFADIDERTQNITAATIEPLITTQTRAILPVHLGGWPCDMPAIMALAARHDLTVIEDCAQAHGASFRDHRAGSFGHAAAFSFCEDKIISTGGEGGMLVLADEQTWRRAWAFKDHGKDHDLVFEHTHPPGFRWLHSSFGTNWRMTEMQAAIGRVQLRKLGAWRNARSENALSFRDALTSHPSVDVPWPTDHETHAFYRFYFYINPDLLRDGWNRVRIIETLRALGIGISGGSCPEIYRERAFVDARLAPREPLPGAVRVGERSVALEVHPNLTNEARSRATNAIIDTLQTASR